MKLEIIWQFLTALILLQSVSAQSAENPQQIVYFIPTFWGNIFEPNPKQIVYYDLEPMHRLHKLAAESGYDLRVGQLTGNGLRDPSGKGPEYPENFAYLIIFEFGEYLVNCLSKYPKEKLILMLWEPPTTMPQDYNLESHQMFSRVYTWHDDLVDNNKYFKFYYPVLRPMTKNPIDFDEKKKLCVMVAGNKTSWEPNELYTERRNLIEFFETNHTFDFDFFGGGWPETYKTYKGRVEGGLEQKVEKLKHYKFAIAYENGKNIPGYITEKIFDCFTAGTVPVYWGASNISSYIPQNCFVSRENFKSNEELYHFIKNMPKDQYMKYIKNIQKFLGSEQAQVFSHDIFIKIMMKLFTTPPIANVDVSQTTTCAS